MVMEYVDGPTLQDLLVSEGRMPWRVRRYAPTWRRR
jgi:hypothetical protein